MTVTKFEVSEMKKLTAELTEKFTYFGEQFI